MPEGLAVGVAFATGDVAQALPLAVGIAVQNMPEGLAFAAGAMLFVISHEIIPETHHRKGHEAVATWGLVGGFVVMMLFDTVLG